MAGSKIPDKVITVELKVSMHCNACEREVKKALSKLDGVASVSTDMKKHRASVTGRVDPQMVLEKLKKKTGKRVEFWSNPDRPKKASSGSNVPDSAGLGPQRMPPPIVDEGPAFFMLFSDDNPNSCAII